MPTMLFTCTPIPGRELEKGALKANTPPSEPTRKYPVSVAVAVGTMPVMLLTRTPRPGREP